jgi:hypothetical protein
LKFVASKFKNFKFLKIKVLPKYPRQHPDKKYSQHTSGMDTKTQNTLADLKNSIELDLRAQIQRKKFEQTFISGVHSTPLLALNSTLRKHFEYCSEAVEEIEKLFFLSNNQNFLFAGEDYGALLSEISRFLDGRQALVREELFLKKLIPGLGGLCKKENKKKFLKGAVKVVERFKKVYGLTNSLPLRPGPLNGQKREVVQEKSSQLKESQVIEKDLLKFGQIEKKSGQKS